ncbi:hypothetical protein DFH08DRAFT_705361 [Mycena albidolilacea]|uniref:Uncharacterized protein n=1 Tax=Mycena albidolilacea TaxID=1033008 RepID=A0AAD6ZTD6_9AGAR|nr:hypothetical protein DFH08DRAFT_705361 [Mycena albidolilacea]
MNNRDRGARVFQTGADRVSPHVCANCLGRHKHWACSRGPLWDGSCACWMRNEQGRPINPSGIELCSDFQHPEGCSSKGHDKKHECAGCGQHNHGVQKCPRTERA